MEKSLEKMTKWLRQSGLKVNEEKTKLCLHYKKNVAATQIKVFDTRIMPKPVISVLGIATEAELSSALQVSNVVKSK